MKMLGIRKDAFSLMDMAKHSTKYFFVDYDDVFALLADKDDEYISHLICMVESESNSYKADSSTMSSIISMISTIATMLMFLAVNAITNNYGKVLAGVAFCAIAAVIAYTVNSAIAKKNNRIRNYIKDAATETLVNRSKNS